MGAYTRVVVYGSNVYFSHRGPLDSSSGSTVRVIGGVLQMPVSSTTTVHSDDIVDVLIILLSDWARYINGAILDVNGGYVLCACLIRVRSTPCAGTSGVW